MSKTIIYDKEYIDILQQNNTDVKNKALVFLRSKVEYSCKKVDTDKKMTFGISKGNTKGKISYFESFSIDALEPKNSALALPEIRLRFTSLGHLSSQPATPAACNERIAHHGHLDSRPVSNDIAHMYLQPANHEPPHMISLPAYPGHLINPPNVTLLKSKDTNLGMSFDHSGVQSYTQTCLGDTIVKNIEKQKIRYSKCGECNVKPNKKVLKRFETILYKNCCWLKSYLLKQYAALENKVHTGKFF